MTGTYTASFDYMRGRTSNKNYYTTASAGVPIKALGGRKRPQAVIWADNIGELSASVYIPSGEEWTDFIILSDHNRSEISIETERIETRQRMINGGMRSYHIADKNKFSWSWEMIPSRAYAEMPIYSASGGLINDNLTSGRISRSNFQNTYDGGAGGVELLNWYNSHKDSFYMILAYDRYDMFPSTDPFRYSHLDQYNIIYQVFFSSFNHTIVKRAGLKYDFWNIQVSLEQV